jgi:hypothetical protein
MTCLHADAQAGFPLPRKYRLLAGLRDKENPAQMIERDFIFEVLLI